MLSIAQTSNFRHVPELKLEQVINRKFLKSANRLKVFAVSYRRKQIAAYKNIV